MNDQELIPALVDLTRAAGRAILEIYGEAFAVETKADESPLTQADLNAHRVIAKGLQSIAPELPIVSEEAALPAWSQRQGWTRYWLVDPLDGTKEFVNRNGEFTVNIALIEGGRAILGVVGVPVRDHVYAGYVPAARAEKHTSSGVVPLAVRRMAGRKSLAVVASRSHGGERLENYIGALRAHFDEVDRTPIGSSLKLCLLAEGGADLYPRLGPTSEWDIAAAHAVLAAAGGALWRLDRSPLAYNTKESFLNPDFVAVADPTFDWWRVLPDL
ncbi:MAG: 3'(2'),5'-bisphosphate nucleotidase CysQ [Gammaproteobacteria bacterium]|nr:3'(2'),5'-bisphosphate nucleotidase CysQ [Gammaproteobacteria bacterium]